MYIDIRLNQPIEKLIFKYLTVLFVRIANPPHFLVRHALTLTYRTAMKQKDCPENQQNQGMKRFRARDLVFLDPFIDPAKQLTSLGYTRQHHNENK
jgi:hypothetical protein